MKKKSSSLGGKRDGAGRKAGPEGKRKPLSFTLPPQIFEFFEENTGSVSRSVLVEQIIRASPQFAAWSSKK